MEWTLTTALSGVVVLAGAAVFTTVSLVRSTSEAANPAAFIPVSLVESRPAPAALTPQLVLPLPLSRAISSPIAPAALADPAAPVENKNQSYQTAAFEPTAKSAAIPGRPADEPSTPTPNLNRAIDAPRQTLPNRDQAIETPGKPATNPNPTKLASKGPSAAASKESPPVAEQWRVLRSPKANAFNLGGHIDQAGVVDSLASSHLRDAFKTLSTYKKLPQHVRTLIEAQKINLSRLAPYRSLLGIDDKKLEDEQGVRFERVSKR